MICDRCRTVRQARTIPRFDNKYINSIVASINYFIVNKAHCKIRPSTLSLMLYQLYGFCSEKFITKVIPAAPVEATKRIMVIGYILCTAHKGGRGYAE